MSTTRRLIGALSVGLVLAGGVSVSTSWAGENEGDAVEADDGAPGAGKPPPSTIDPDPDENDDGDGEGGDTTPGVEPPSCDGVPQVADEPPEAPEGTVMVFGDEIRRRVRHIDCIANSATGFEGLSHLVWVTIGSIGDITEPVVAAAIAKVPKPNAGFSPALDPFTYVNMETAFWVTNVDWSVPFTDTDTQFGITVTVNVWPESVSFDPGDGSPPATCPNAGVEGVGPAGGGCGHTYRAASEGYPGVLTVHYRVEIFRTIGGDEIRSFENSTAYTVPVGEIQTVVE